ncbi:MAG TPA: hypothetical protein DD725_04350 [Deltaproteobacteria bacterium]|nr:hypothetical protein [Deltaproteobacteria bacterium]
MSRSGGVLSEELSRMKGFLSRIWLEADYLNQHYQRYSGKLDGSTRAEIMNCFKTIDITIELAKASVDLALSQSKDVM